MVAAVAVDIPPVRTHWTSSERLEALDSLAAARQRWAAKKPPRYRYTEAWSHGFNYTYRPGTEHVIVAGGLTVGVRF